MTHVKDDPLFFVSYRRPVNQTGGRADTDQSLAQAIVEWGNLIFNDIAGFIDINTEGDSNICFGEHFPTRIAHEINRRKWFFPIIGKDWMSKEPDLKDEGDWVSKEIKIALERRPEIMIVPIVCGLTSGEEALLRDSQPWIKDINWLQIPKLQDFHTPFKKIVKVFKELAARDNIPFNNANVAAAEQVRVIRSEQVSDSTLKTLGEENRRRFRTAKDAIERGDWRQASDLFEAIEIAQRTKETPAMVLEHKGATFIALRQYRQAVGVFRELLTRSNDAKSRGRHEHSLRVSYTSLMHELRSEPDTRRILAEMMKLGVVPSIETYTAAATTYSGRRSLQTRLEEITAVQASGLQLDVRYLTVMLKGLKKPADIERILGVATSLGVELDTHAFNAWLHAAHPEDVPVIVERMAALDVPMDKATYNIRIKKSLDFETGMTVFGELERDNNVWPDQHTLEHLFRLRGCDSGEARNLIEENKAKHGGKHLNTFTYNKYLSKLRDHGSVQKVIYEEMSKQRIRPDRVSFNHLIRTAPTINEARRYLNDMASAQLNYDGYTVRYLRALGSEEVIEDAIRKSFGADLTASAMDLSTQIETCNDYLSAISLLEDDKVIEDVSVAEGLIKLASKSDNPAHLLEIEERVQCSEFGEAENERVQIALLKHATNFEDALQQFSLLKPIRQGLRPRAVTVLADHAKDRDQVSRTVDEVIEIEARVDNRFADSLLTQTNRRLPDAVRTRIDIDPETRARTFERIYYAGLWSNVLSSVSSYFKIAMPWRYIERGLNLIEHPDRPAPPRIWNTILGYLGERPIEEGLPDRVLLEMERRKVGRTEKVYNILIRRAESREQAQVLLREMQTNGFAPDENTWAEMCRTASGLAEATTYIDRVEVLLSAKTGDERQPSLQYIQKNLYVAAMKSCLNDQEVWELLERIKKMSFRQIEDVWSEAVWKASNLSVAGEIMEEMVRAGLHPNNKLHNRYLGKAESYVTARRIYEKMLLDWHLSPDHFTINTMIDKSETREHYRNSLELFRIAGIPYTKHTYDKRIMWAVSLEQAMEEIEAMKDAGFVPDEETCIALKERATTAEETSLVSRLPCCNLA